MIYTSKVFEIIAKEQARQDRNVELIASENFVSDNVLKAMGSCLTNKYAEGYPNNRYYGGCQYVDELETYCKENWQEAFKTDYHVNVQPHSGTNANLAAYMALMPQYTNGKDTRRNILSMSLDNGGHLSHGSPVNISGKVFNFYHYGVDENGLIDYDEIERQAYFVRPYLIVAGASAYPRNIDFKRIREICYKYNAYMMVDMAHIAGLVLTGEHPSPFGLADVITTTTHKTLRCARGGLIFCKPELAKRIDSAVFPCTQGGPLMNMIAGKAVGAEECCTQEYKDYIHQVVLNAKAMANRFVELGFDLVTGGTDNHLLLIDFIKTHDLTGKQAQDLLDEHYITANKNCVPNETRSPQEASGLRIGTPAMTTKGWKEKDFVECADKIAEILKPHKK